MPTFKTDFKTQQDARDITLQYNPSATAVQSPLRVARVSYTCVGTEVTADVLDLAFLRVKNARIMPELSRISNPTGSGSVIIGAKLQKCSVDAAGTITATDLSAVADVSNNSVTFARITGGDIPTIAADEYVRILLSTTASTTFTMAAGQVIDFDLVYQAPDAP